MGVDDFELAALKQIASTMKRQALSQVGRKNMPDSIGRPAHDAPTFLIEIKCWENENISDW